MRKTLLLVFIFICSYSFGQTIKRMSVNSSGASSPNLLYSVGQLVAFSKDVSGNNITIGYQQPVRIPLDTTLKIKADTTVCVKDSVTLLTSVSPHANWYRNDTLINGADSAFYVIKTSGKYKALLYDDYGFNELTRTVNVIVYPSLLPPPPVNPVTICQGTKTTPLTAIASQGADLIWYGLDSTGGVQSSIAPIPSTSATGTFNYYVSQKPTDALCESQRAKLIVTIASIPTKASPDSISYCALAMPSAINLNFGSDILVNWYGTDSINGTASYSAPIVSTAFAGRTNYYYTKQSKLNKCESGRSMFTVIVNPLPEKPTISRDPNGNLVSSSAIGNQWYKDTSEISGASSFIFKPDVNGTYRVKVTDGGCISPLSTPYYYLTTGIVNYSNGQYVKIYPNPVRDYLHLEWKLNGEKDLKLIVYDQSGKMLMRKTDMKSGETLNISGLVSGVYRVVVLNKSNKVLYQTMLYKD